MARDSDIIELRKQPGESFDWSTFLIAILLITVGLISIYSATYDAGMSSYFFKQLIFSGVGILVMIGTMLIPERWLQSKSYGIYGITLLLLVAVLIFGTISYGTKGWFHLGIFSLQPSELAKVACLLLIAQYLSRKGTDVKTLRDLGIVSSLIIVPFFLVLLEPDTGTATVLIALYVGILFWTGFDIFILFMAVSVPIIIILSFISRIYFITSVSIFAIIAAFFKRKILITFLVIAVVFVVGYFSPILVNQLMPHQKNRIETFLSPEKEPLGKGYNVIQSKLAVGSGGLTGKGFLQGTQTQLRYIPKQWTDFIYCVPTEEFGFIGGILVILLYAALILRALKIASEIESKFLSIVCFGIATIFFYHVLINIGMVIGLMPVMGIPLPFMSYGGSSLIANCAMVGLMLNGYRSQRRLRR